MLLKYTLLFQKKKNKGGIVYLVSDTVFRVKIAHSCPTLCKPMDYTVHEILQARILAWAVLPFSRGSFQPRN